VEHLEFLRGGNARKAWVFDASWRLAGERFREACVMLVQEEAGQVESDIAHEFRVLRALHESPVPAPHALWLDAEGVFLDSPGLVMRRLPGRSELWTLLDAEHRARNRALALGMATAGAALHAVDWRGADLLGLLVPTPEDAALRQVEHWEALFLAHRMEPLPVLVDAFRWLSENAPVADRIALVHGDFRFGNILYEGEHLRGLLDWEMAHLGDPCEDLAWAYRPLWSPQGQLPFEEFVAAYERQIGVSLSDFGLRYYRLFSEVKHAVISLTGARAFASGRTRNLRLADRLTWVPECLLQFQRLRAAALEARESK